MGHSEYNGVRIRFSRDTCVQRAQRTFQRRKDKDTKPTIVQMTFLGEPIDHWYYRSDQWVEQPYLLDSFFVQPYVGPTNGHLPSGYRSGFVVDRDLTALALTGPLEEEEEEEEETVKGKPNINSPAEFLAVRHSVLNGNTYDVGRLVEDTLSLGKHVPNRTIVPCFEGDVLQVRETGEVVLTHQNFFPLSQKKYADLKARGLASSLTEVLDKIAAYKQKSGSQKVVLCLELKSITSRATIEETVRKLREYDIREAYFDSFFGNKLDVVDEVNQTQGTKYRRSLHLIGNYPRGQFLVTSAKRGYEVLTVPHTLSCGKVDEPIIYGAVGSTEILERIAQEELVKGAYVRLNEGSGFLGSVVKLWNSVTNTERLRKTHLAEYRV